MKTILITGGAGFIGSHLCHQLASSNKVICLDDLSTGSLDRIQDLLSHSNFTFIHQDISKLNPKEYLDLKIDEIYHLACPASPPEYQKNPLKTIKTCLYGTLKVLKLAKHQEAKFLFTSTSEIYGDPLESPQKESYWGNVNPIGKRSCYDEGKRMCETIITEYRNKHHLDLKIVRLFNTYGPGMDLHDGRVITNFIQAIIKQEQIPIYGQGDQTRSFCYIDDTVKGIIAIMNHSLSGPINLGNPIEMFRIIDLIPLFEEISHQRLTINYLPLPSDDPKRRQPDITLAQTLLNWSPEVSLKLGLEKTYFYFRKILDVSNEEITSKKLFK